MVNHETIIGTLSLFKILPLNGFNPIRAKQKFLRRRKEAHESFSSRLESRKSFTLTTHRNLPKSCEDLSWNDRTSTPPSSETSVISGRAVRRIKEGTSAELLQSGLNKKWWADSMECNTSLRNIQDLLSDGRKLHTKGVLENHLKDQSFRLAHWLSILLFRERPVKAPTSW